MGSRNAGFRRDDSENVSGVAWTLWGWGVAASFLLLCIAHVLILPPYEGFDETAHYSYISYLSDVGEIPNFRSTPLDATTEQDRRGLPRPYSSVPPFERNGGITYADFFTKIPVEQRRTALERFWGAPENEVRYEPGRGINWEGQHPPLYYLSMVPCYRLARALSPSARILTLRLYTVGIVAISLLFWWKTVTMLRATTMKGPVVLGGVAILFFPSLFYDLARIGNDSMAAAAFSALLYFLLRTYVDRQRGMANFIGLGLSLGLGILTKMYFVPLAVGVVAVTIWLRSRTKIRWGALAARLGATLAIAAALGSAWLVFCYRTYGQVIGRREVHEIHPIYQSPGETHAWLHFIFQWFRSAAAFVATFLWSGTWSWVHIPLWCYMAFAPFFALLALQAWRRTRVTGNTEEKDLLTMILLLIGPVFVGFAYHMSMVVISTGHGSRTAGYYLFFAWPALAIVFSHVLVTDRGRGWSVATLIALGVLLLFEAYGWWYSMQVYSGIVVKVGTSKTGIGYVPPTIGNISLVLSRLDELVYPLGAVVCYGFATLIRVVMVAKAVNTLPYARPTHAQRLPDDHSKKMT